VTTATRWNAHQRGVSATTDGAGKATESLMLPGVDAGSHQTPATRHQFTDGQRARVHACTDAEPTLIELMHAAKGEM